MAAIHQPWRRLTCASAASYRAHTRPAGPDGRNLQDGRSPSPPPWTYRRRKRRRPAGSVPMPAARTDDAALTSLMNVGRAVGARFEALGPPPVGQLAGADPLDLFERMEEQAGHREDPCLLDTLLSAVDQADGNPGRPW